MREKTAFWAPLLVLFSMSCGGGEEETLYEWECYSWTDLGTCACYEVKKGSSVSVGSATKVDDCGGYEVCMSYYDSPREQGRCDCGGEDFEPSVTQRRDTKKVDTCPVDE